MSENQVLRIASFALAIPLYKAFDYSLPADQPVVVGGRYRLPFGSGYRTGILLTEQETSLIPGNKIKQSIECLDREAVVSEHMMSLAAWMAHYYLQPPGEVLFQCLPGYLRGTRAEKPARVKYWRTRSIDSDLRDQIERRSPRQFEILLALEQAEGGLNAVQLKQINPGWHGFIRALEAREAVSWDWSIAAVVVPETTVLPELSSEQQASYAKIKSASDGFSVHLLDGITGSGKTEVYFRLIQDQLDRQRQVIYMVPEIGLTSQLVDRVRQRFGEQFSISHSALTEKQRYDAWDRFQRGDVGLMLGTRSSLFSQSDCLGMIVIDEEHDHSYKQEDGIRYQARDVAIKRAQMLDIPILLGSATPSLESLNNCEREYYFYHQLSKRPTGFAPPRVQLIDTRNLKLDCGCSKPLLARIDEHLGRNGQVLLYLNRRGYAPIVMCHECGWQASCTNCDSKLTLHQSLRQLLCHHCGFTCSPPEQCPDCGNPETKHYGIGTEQLEQGLIKRFPEYPVLRIDRDVITSRDDLAQRLAKLREGEPCLLIGTQMIAKGHDYPGITMSAILDADQALFSASYRASERLAQTVFQVSGRAGRGDLQGEAYLQTSFTDHPLMQSVVQQSYREIAINLTRERKMLGFPPFARVVMFRADGESLEMAINKLGEIKNHLQESANRYGIKCIGPIPALMTRRIGRYRGQLCLLGQDIRKLRQVLRETMPDIETVASTASVKWVVDVDAIDL